jgi:hypothetical protein
LIARRSSVVQDAPVPRAHARALDSARVDECLQLLARAIQQFHTYPSTSPLCQSAVEACQRVLVSLEQRDQVGFRVAPHELVVDEVPVGRGTLVEHELARRLHIAAIAQVTVERTVSIRELSRFCLDLVRCSDLRGSRANLIEMIAEHGVDRIALRPAYRPEVLEIPAPPAPVTSLVQHQRKQREELLAGGGVNHLYPPDKGWVRLDPSTPLASVSLVDLALLARDPESLATMLLRLTDEEAAAVTEPGDALTQKFSDVAMIFASLDPNIARTMFSKLARAVLQLDPSRRQTLLRRTILPGLLDGKIDGMVLRDFPDVELADALCLLLDLETAAPEVVSTALARLDLPPDRNDAVLPLINQRLEGRAPDAAHETSIDAHARKLLRIDRDRAKSFAEFASFDLSLDDHTAAELDQIRDDIAATDIASTQLACLLRLTRLEANPEIVQRFADRVVGGLEQMERDGRWTVLASWLPRYREIADAMRESRPDVSEVLDRRLEAYCTHERAARLLDLASRDGDGRTVADAIFAALGAAVAPGLVAAALGSATDTKDARSKAVLQVLTDHARLVAPAVAEALKSTDAPASRAAVRILGVAGAGYEDAIAAQLTSRDEQTVREALRALAKTGTPSAAAAVRTAIERYGGWLSGAAAETLWHFPAAEAHRQIRDLLGHRDFVIKKPEVAVRMLDRATQAGADGLEPVLPVLASLRFRIWSPALARGGRRAHALLTR